MWKQIVGTPSMEGLVKKPDVLSFCIASKIPVSESTRQELLDIDGISYRLRREIEILENIDLIRCKICQVIIIIPMPCNFAHNIGFFANIYRDSFATNILFQLSSSADFNFFLFATI